MASDVAWAKALPNKALQPTRAAEPNEQPGGARSGPRG